MTVERNYDYDLNYDLSRIQLHIPVVVKNVSLHTESYLLRLASMSFTFEYTLPQKKRNFPDVAFLLGRSVGQ